MLMQNTFKLCATVLILKQQFDHYFIKLIFVIMDEILKDSEFQYVII